MSWTGNRVRNLRKKLGWTVSDLARRLGCSAEIIKNMESAYGDNLIGSEVEQQLEIISLQLQRNTRHMLTRPVVDRLLNQSNKDQLSSEDLEEYMHELKKLEN